MASSSTSQKQYRIAIIGLGMVGTPIKDFLEAERGYRRGTDLFLYDKDPAKAYRDDVNQADIIFISVPTPPGPGGGADISAVRDAFAHIKKEDAIVVIKSTVPPGTTETLQREYPKRRVLFNPEFLTEKRAGEDFRRPDRQIVGFTDSSLDAAYAVLSILPRAPFMSPGGVGTYRPVRITATEAEIIKYGGNVHFARKINLANILAGLAENHHMDYENVRLGMSADYRIGDSHLDVAHGGYRGFGGFCFPKDLDALIAHLEERGLADAAALLKKDREYNERLLASQGLTLQDVSVHDHEWIKKKMSGHKPSSGA